MKNKKRNKAALSKKDKAAIKKTLLELAKQGYGNDLAYLSLVLQKEFIAINLMEN